MGLCQGRLAAPIWALKHSGYAPDEGPSSERSSQMNRKASNRKRKRSKTKGKGRAIPITSHRGRALLEELLGEASLAHGEGRFFDAEWLYRKALALRPKWAAVLSALGTVLLAQDQADEAREAFERALHAEPDYASAHYNLGRLHQLQGEYQEAARRYRALLKLDSEYAAAWSNLAIALREMCDVEGVISYYRKALEIAPDVAEVWNNFGVGLDEEGYTAEAVQAYIKALDLQANYIAAHFNLGLALQKVGSEAEAADHYRAVLKMSPEDVSARYLLQSLGETEAPEAAPVEYIRKVFDGCAPRFEETFVKRLKYRTPELLFELVRPFLGQNMDGLDLGCGTGLGSGYYRPYSGLLVGVDVSTKMLALAAEKGTYDRLEVRDILEEWDLGSQFDLIYSSDVLVYVGELGTVFRQAYAHFAPGGLFAFSVERLPESEERPYQLCTTGRYRHSCEFVREASCRHGFRILREQQAVLREERGGPVEGLLVVSRKETG